MDDVRLAELLARSDTESGQALCDAYGDRLYAYCCFLLAEPAAATGSPAPDGWPDDGASSATGTAEARALAATRDTFLVAAASIGGLRRPGLLGPWLYALARNECLRVRDGSPPAFRRSETTELVERHGLGPAGAAAVLGVTAQDVEPRSSTGPAGPPGHAVGQPRFPAAPPALWAEVAAGMGATGAAGRALLARRARPFDAEGFPVPLDRRRISGRVLAWSTVAAVLIALTLLVVVPAEGTPETAAFAGPAPAVPGESAAPLEPPVTKPAPPAPIEWPASTAAPAPPPASTEQARAARPPTSARPARLERSRPPAPPATRPGGARPEPPPGGVDQPAAGQPGIPPATDITVVARFEVRSVNCAGEWSAQAVAGVAGVEQRELRSVVARWRDPDGGPVRTVPLRPGQFWTGELTGLPVDRSLVWSVQATAADGRVAESASAPLYYSCRARAR